MIAITIAACTGFLAGVIVQCLLEDRWRNR